MPASDQLSPRTFLEMSFTKWFKAGGRGRNARDSVAFKDSKKKTKKRSEEDYYTQDDMEGYVYDNDYHYQPAPGLQPQGYGYSQRMAAKPRKPRLAAQEGHFDAEELTRRLLDVLAEQKMHEVKRQRAREARAAMAAATATAADSAVQWQQRQEAAISSLNRAPTTAGRMTGLRKPSKSYADDDIEAAEEHEHRHTRKDSTSPSTQADTNNVIGHQDQRVYGEHHRRSSELAVEIPLAQHIRALPHQIQPQLVKVPQRTPPPGSHRDRGQTGMEKAKRRHSLSLEVALSKISAAWTSGADDDCEMDHATAISSTTSPTAGKQQHSGESKEGPGSLLPPNLLAVTMQNIILPSSSQQQEHNQPVTTAAESANNVINPAEKTTLPNECDDLSALPSPTTQTQTHRFRVGSSFVKKSPSLLNLRQKLGMGSSGSGSGSSSSSPASPVTANSSSSGGSSGLEGATSPLTAASSAVADNLPQPQTQTQSQSQQPQPGNIIQEKKKDKEKTRMNNKKSGFFAKLVGGNTKKGVF